MSEASLPGPEYIPLEFQRLAPDQQRERLRAFFELMDRRRTVRDFSPEPVPLELVERAIETAGTAPSGANMQPWHFVVVRDPDVKRRIRAAAETEERISYESRMPERWLRRLALLGTDWHKPFLEVAPFLIIVFRRDFELDQASGDREPTYYATESVGISVGLLLAALHTAGLATLTHTPSPMRFLSDILGRPRNERPFVLIPVGYPAPGAKVPDIDRKQLGEIMTLV